MITAIRQKIASSASSSMALYLKRESKVIHNICNQGLPHNSRPLRKLVSYLRMESFTLVRSRSYSSNSGELVEAVVPYMGESIIDKFLTKQGDRVEPRTKVAIVSKSGGGVTQVAHSVKPPSKPVSEPSCSEKKVDKPTPNKETLLPKEKPKSPFSPSKPSASEPQLPPNERERTALYLRRRSKVIHINQGFLTNSRPLSKEVSYLRIGCSTLVGSRSYSSDNGETVEAVVPSMGESITDGIIATLLKKPGDHVDIDEPIAKVEAHKVTIDVASPESGFIKEFLAKEGDRVEPHAKIAIILKCPEGVIHSAPPEKSLGKRTPEPSSSEKEVNKPMPEEQTLLPERKTKSPSPSSIPSASEPKIGGRREVLDQTICVANAMFRKLEEALNRDCEEEIAEGTLVWDLRLICDYAYENEKFEIKNVTIHGIWKGHIENGIVVHDNNESNPDTALAKQLLEELTDRYPDIRAKMDKHWVSINHTSSQKTIWYHEMCKHGTMDYAYWIKTINAASQFFAEDGTCRLLDMMKAAGYRAGCHSTKDFQRDMGIMIGRKIHTTYKKKKGKNYLQEFAFLFDGTTKFMLNYPEQPLDAQEFVIEEHQVDS